MHLTSLLTLKPSELITWGYWTKLVASPSGRQSQAACPADFFKRYIQRIFLQFDCRSSRCTAQLWLIKVKGGSNPSLKENTTTTSNNNKKKHPKTKARMLGCHLNIYTYTPQNISGSQNVSTHMAIVSIPGIRWLREENRCFSFHYCTCMSSTRQNTSIVKSGIF